MGTSKFPGGAPSAPSPARPTAPRLVRSSLRPALGAGPSRPFRHQSVVDDTAARLGSCQKCRYRSSMTADTENPAPVFLFLDESGTDRDSPLTLIGATAYHDVARAELAIAQAYARALGDDSLWPDESKREQFARVGFHFTADSESVKSTLLSTLDSIEFRAYAAFSRQGSNRDTTDLLVAMYGTLLTSVLARYRGYALTVVFEQSSMMDPLYGKIWAVLQNRVGGIESAVRFEARKPRRV